MNVADKSKLLQTLWETKGLSYAREINAMIAFGENHGWENWKGKEPVDDRDEVSLEVLSLLRKANKEGSTAAFRTLYPPAYAPFINIIQEQGQHIENLCFINN